MNKKGQALVEFVLILPVFLLILFVIIDLGVVFSQKNSIENQSSDIIRMYLNGKNIEEIKKLYPEQEITINNEQGQTKVIIVKNVKLITPGAYQIFGNPYTISVERIIENE